MFPANFEELQNYSSVKKREHGSIFNQYWEHLTFKSYNI